jgi:hypothetical protein
MIDGGRLVEERQSAFRGSQEMSAAEIDPTSEAEVVPDRSEPSTPDVMSKSEAQQIADSLGKPKTESEGGAP